MKDTKASSAMTSTGASNVGTEPALTEPKQITVRVKAKKGMKSTALSADEDALVRPTTDDEAEKRCRKLLADFSAMQGQPVQGQPVQGQPVQGQAARSSSEPAQGLTAQGPEIHLARRLLAGFEGDADCWSKDQCAQIIKAAEALEQYDTLTPRENVIFLTALDQNDYPDDWRRMIEEATQASSQG